MKICYSFKGDDFSRFVTEDSASSTALVVRLNETKGETDPSLQRSSNTETHYFLSVHRQARTKFRLQGHRDIKHGKLRL